MISNKEIKLALSNKEISDKAFLTLHFAVEAYLQRLLLIGLRVNGVQYSTAKKCTEIYYEGIKHELEKIWHLLKINKDSINSFKLYKELENYMLNFTSKYRNLRVHGVYSQIQDLDLLNCLIKIDKAYVNEIEFYFKANYLPSAFAEPKVWCRRLNNEKIRGSIDNLETVFNNFLGKNKANSAISKEIVNDFISKNNL